MYFACIVFDGIASEWDLFFAMHCLDGIAKECTNMRLVLCNDFIVVTKCISWDMYCHTMSL